MEKEAIAYLLFCVNPKTNLTYEKNSNVYSTTIVP